MMEPNQTNQPSKCFRCSYVISPIEDSSNCIFCGVTYCNMCLGYTKHFDMDELESMIMKQISSSGQKNKERRH
mgnify:CR=1 FL=1